MTAAAFAACAAIGAIARWAINVIATVDRRHLATFIVNVTGAFLLGLVVAHGSNTAATVVGTGGLGALTTFSTMTLDLDDLPRPAAGSYLVATLAGGVVAAWAGLHV